MYFFDPFDTGAARKESTVGEIVNLMSVDVQRFMDLLPYLNMLWSAPLQIVLCCIFMYQELEYSIFPGVAIMIAAIPLNGVVAGNDLRYFFYTTLFMKVMLMIISALVIH